VLFTRLRETKEPVKYENYFVSSQIIEASHQRCREKRVNPALSKIPQLPVSLYLDNVFEGSNELLLAAKPVIKHELYPYFMDEDQLIILCNPEGYAVYLMSSPKTLELCFNMNICLGTCFREEICGTNAISLAMHLNKPVLIKGEQHYCQLFTDWSCTAMPVRSAGGDIAGYLDVSMDSEKPLIHASAMVRMTVKYIEKILAEQGADKRTSPETVSLDTLNRFETLSSREKQVLASMAKGKTAGEISRTIGISEATVKTYRKRIYQKLGVKDKTGCLNKAREIEFFIE